MFKNILKKEFLLISRDIHALLVLFVMPTLFILIMSIALKNTYSNNIDIKLKIAFINTNSISIKNIASDINTSNYFQTFIIESTNIKNILYAKKFDFVVKINEDLNISSQNIQIEVFKKPSVSIQYYEILKNLLINDFSKNSIRSKLSPMIKDFDSLMPKISTSMKDVFKNETESKITSVQQNVPAWLIFSMFFIVIPISNAFINEKNYSTLDRIKSINLPNEYIIFGKLIPYFIVNQIQVFLMFLVGIYLVPLLGGDSLVINGNYFLLFLVSFATSLMAISFALFIANISKTTEVATSIGGVFNIILAAIGGVMVPKIVMPDFMQNIASLSPMSWALDSFVEILTNNANFEDIFKNLTCMIIFAIFFLTLTSIILKKRK